MLLPETRGTIAGVTFVPVVKGSFDLNDKMLAYRPQNEVTSLEIPGTDPLRKVDFEYDENGQLHLRYNLVRTLPICTVCFVFSLVTVFHLVAACR